MERAFGVMLADFAGEGAGELTIQQGEEVTLVQAEEAIPDGWLLVSHGGIVGFVPETFVEETGAPAPPPITHVVGRGDFEPEGEAEIAVRTDGAPPPVPCRKPV